MPDLPDARAHQQGACPAGGAGWTGADMDLRNRAPTAWQPGRGRADRLARRRAAARQNRLRGSTWRPQAAPPAPASNSGRPFRADGRRSPPPGRQVDAPGAGLCAAVHATRPQPLQAGRPEARLLAECLDLTTIPETPCADVVRHDLRAARDARSEAEVPTSE